LTAAIRRPAIATSVVEEGVVVPLADWAEWATCESPQPAEAGALVPSNSAMLAR